MDRFLNSTRAAIFHYDRPKWEKDARVIKTVYYSNVEGFDLVTGDKAKEIEEHTDDIRIDDLHTYLVLKFEYDTELVFPDSYVDLFPVLEEEETL